MKSMCLVVHDEPKDRPTRAAAKAFEDLSLRIDLEGRRPFPMKWAQCPVRSARPLEGEIPTDHLDDVVCGGDLFDDLLRNARHSAM
jgi:hypothetical protein